MEDCPTRNEPDGRNSVRRGELRFIIELLNRNFNNGVYHIAEVLQQAEFRSHNYLRIYGEEFCRQLNSEVSMFAWLLARAAGCWVDLLLD